MAEDFSSSCFCFNWAKNLNRNLKSIGTRSLVEADSFYWEPCLIIDRPLGSSTFLSIGGPEICFYCIALYKWEVNIIYGGNIIPTYMAILDKPLQGSHPYKPIPVSSNTIRVLNVAQMTSVLIWLWYRWSTKKGHVDMTVCKPRHYKLVIESFLDFFPSNLAKLSIFLLASQIWDALSLHLGSVPDIRNIGSHDLILRYCMLQRWFGGWAKKERVIFLVRDPGIPINFHLRLLLGEG